MPLLHPLDVWQKDKPNGWDVFLAGKGDDVDLVERVSCRGVDPVRPWGHT